MDIFSLPLTRADPPPPAEKIYNRNPLVLLLMVLVLLLLSSPHGKAGSAGKYSSTAITHDVRLCSSTLYGCRALRLLGCWAVEVV